MADGDVLPLPGAPQIVGMPGHSPGSVAVYVPLADAVFVGDALTTRHVLTGVPARSPPPSPMIPNRLCAHSITSRDSAPTGCCPGTALPGGASSRTRSLSCVRPDLPRRPRVRCPGAAPVPIRVPAASSGCVRRNARVRLGRLLPPVHPAGAAGSRGGRDGRPRRAARRVRRP